MLRNIKTILHFFRLTNQLSKSYIGKTVINSILKAITPFINIIMPKLIIDELMNEQRMKVMIIYVSVLTIGNLILKLLKDYMNKIMELASLELFQKINTYIGKKCVEMDFEYIEDPEILDLKEKAYFSIHHMNAIGQTLENAAKIFYEFITLLGLGYILSILNPLIIVVIIGIVLLNSVIFKKIERIRFEDNQKSIYDERAFGYFLRLTSDFSIGKDIRLYNGKTLLIKRMKYFTDKLLKIYSRQFTLIGKYSGLSNVNIQFQTTIIYGYLAYKVFKEHITIGSFTMYANAVRNFSTSIMSLINAFIEINQLCMYLEIFMSFENLKTADRRGSYKVENIQDYTIKFKNVSFKYPKKDNYTIKNVSIIIKPGEKLSVVGLNGAGKTTFIKLLSRLYEPTEGSILLGGIDIAHIQYDEYMKLLAIVFQDFRLLSFTIRENLSFDDGIGEKVMLNSLNQAGFDNDLMKLKRGIDTNIYKDFDKNGVEFSGGQSQKIAIARALCKQAPIVILDEPTSALDPISEYEVYNSFNNLVEGKTAIYISHRLSSTKLSDHIAVFKDGEIVEYGTHQELVEHNDSLYANMYQTQARYYVGG